MNDNAIFQKLIDESTNTKDPKGIVTACLVEDGNIVAIEPSSDDGLTHAEQVLIDKHSEKITNSTVLYSTVIPCSKRSNPKSINCVDTIIESPITQVIFGAKDPGQVRSTMSKMKEHNVQIKQTSDQKSILKCVKLFNETVAPEYKPSVKKKYA